jgi:hypothetical protein
MGYVSDDLSKRKSQAEQGLHQRKNYINQEI